MIVAFLVLLGFQDTISQKLFDFGGHLQVERYSFNNSFEEDPISNKNALLKDLKERGVIEHYQSYSHKPGLLKFDDEVQGVVLKELHDNLTPHDLYRILSMVIS